MMQKMALPELKGRNIIKHCSQPLHMQSENDDDDDDDDDDDAFSKICCY